MLCLKVKKMSINFTDIIQISNPKEYKIHLATWNGHHQPLDIFISDKERWKGWNEWRGEKDEFNRRNIYFTYNHKVSQ